MDRLSPSAAPTLTLAQLDRPVLLDDVHKVPCPRARRPRSERASPAPGIEEQRTFTTGWEEARVLVRELRLGLIVPVAGSIWLSTLASAPRGELLLLCSRS